MKHFKTENYQANIIPTRSCPEINILKKQFKTKKYQVNIIPSSIFVKINILKH